MLVGVPKEIKNHEYRVGLIPAAVRELVHHGHEVLMETNAGAGIGYSDEDYAEVGAQIAPDAKAVFDRVEMIVKVNEAGYVPGGVRLRARIDDTLFTCEAPADRLQELEADPRIESVSVSRPLGIVE